MSFLTARAWQGAAVLGELLKLAGFTFVKYQNLVYSGRRPPQVGVGSLGTATLASANITSESEFVKCSLQKDDISVSDVLSEEAMPRFVELVEARMVQIIERALWYCNQTLLRIFCLFNDRCSTTLPPPRNRPGRLA